MDVLRELRLSPTLPSSKVIPGTVAVQLFGSLLRAFLVGDIALLLRTWVPSV